MSSRSRPTKTPSGKRLRGETASVGAAEGLVTAGRGTIESGILTENRLLELDDLPARLEAELVHEHAPRVLVDLQGLGLAAAAIEGDHQLPAQPLAQRMTGDEGFEVGDEITLAPEREVCVDPFLDRGQVELVQPGDLVLGERVEGEVGERRAPPEVERLTEERRRLERRARRRAPRALSRAAP